MRNPMLAAVLFTAAAAAASSWAEAADTAIAPPADPYKKVSDLVPLPEFIPGLGSLYVDPATLPAGPFLAYDKAGKYVSTVYMVPMDDLSAQKAFDGLAVGGPVDHVDLYYNAGHPGVEAPHYHIVLWAIPEAETEALK